MARAVTLNEPSLFPMVPLPITVVTALVAKSILRMAWLYLSATYRVLPSLVISSVYGPLNWALLPVPFTNPEAPLPAINAV
ncbi:MAG: hypothetical protein ACD_43C00028G0001 [uncultured bacterium]|nr:MAG: hypothetical protein ACD_43C00028G0001 [uncultured bacterium]